MHPVSVVNRIYTLDRPELSGQFFYFTLGYLVAFLEVGRARTLAEEVE